MNAILVVVVVGYLGLAGLLYAVQRSFMYSPDAVRPTPAAYGVGEMMAVGLTTADGLDLLAWWRPPADAAAPIVIYFHGNAGHLGFRADKVRPFLARGWGVLLLGWRGYSGNPGKPTEQGLYADARAALAFVGMAGHSPDKFVLYGESLGAAVAVQMAMETMPAAVVLEAPFASAADVGQRMFPIVPVRLLLRDRFDTMSKIGRMAAPLLIVHGERDATIPVSHGRRLFAEAAEPKQVQFVAEAGHNDLHEHGMAEMVISFVEFFIY